MAGPLVSEVYTKLAVREGDWRSLVRAFPKAVPTPAMVAAFDRARPLWLAQVAAERAGEMGAEVMR